MSRERLFAGVVVVLTAAVVLVSLEVAVRTVLDDGMQFDLEMWKYARQVKRIADDPRIGHEHRPGAHARLMGVDVAIDSMGLRDEDRSYARREGARRILMLGDSVTFGWGVRAEETFSRRLQDRFLRAGLDVEVINSGVGNYNTRMEVAYFLAHGLRFEPDIVVLNYFINDAERTPSYAVAPIERASAAYVYVKSRLDVAARMSGSTQRKGWMDYYHGLYRADSPSSGWPDAKQAIAELARACRERRIALVVAHIPEVRQMAPYPFEAETELLRDWTRRQDVVLLDLLPALREQDPSLLWVTPPDPHPNGFAHALIADAMYEPLLTLLREQE